MCDKVLYQSVRDIPRLATAWQYTLSHASTSCAHASRASHCYIKEMYLNATDCNRILLWRHTSPSAAFNSVCVPAAVYDGHGGNQAAKWVNENLHDFVSSAVGQSKDTKAAMQVAFQVADKELLHYLETASSQGQLLTGAGTTASVVLADTSRVIVANIGDSSVMLSRKGQAEALTVAHRVYGTCAAPRNWQRSWLCAACSRLCAAGQRAAPAACHPLGWQAMLRMCMAVAALLPVHVSAGQNQSGSDSHHSPLPSC